MFVWFRMILQHDQVMNSGRCRRNLQKFTCTTLLVTSSESFSNIKFQVEMNFISRNFRIK